MAQNVFYIVRHGQDTDNVRHVLNGRRDTRLTESGKQQAKAAAQKLQGKGISHIYSSPLHRAQETARIIAGALDNLSVIIEHELIEREFGILTGKTVSEIPMYASEVFDTQKIKYFITADGTESFSDLYARAKRVFQKMNDRHDHAMIILVTHGDIGMMLRAAHEGLGWEQGIREPYIGNAEIVELL